MEEEGVLRIHSMHIENIRELKKILSRFKWLFKIRPAALAELLSKFILPNERRRIIDISSMDICLYVEPFSNLGYSIIENKVYEPKTVTIFHSAINKGDIVLDIGANEGFFSVLAGQIIGKHGKVIAIEPQKRLIDIIEINFSINQLANFRIYNKLFGGIGEAKLN